MIPLSDINECNSSPCKNSGTCTDHVNKYSCSCIPSYTGVHCETGRLVCVTSVSSQGMFVL